MTRPDSSLPQLVLVNAASKSSTVSTTSGFFITIEGGDWTGKSTQASLLEAAINGQIEAGLVQKTYEPGGTTLGTRLREEVMHGEDIDPRTEALLYAADRAWHVHSQIRPWLENGAVVLSDRYFDSSVSYQGQGRGLGVETIRNLSLWATCGLYPDLTLVFDADPVKLASRRPNTGLDRLEQAGIEFHQQVRRGFLKLVEEDEQKAKAANCNGSSPTDLPTVVLPRLRIVNAEGSITQVHRQVIDLVNKQAQKLLVRETLSAKNCSADDAITPKDPLPSKTQAAGNYMAQETLRNSFSAEKFSAEKSGESVPYDSKHATSKEARCQLLKKLAELRPLSPSDVQEISDRQVRR